ncbi:hypothetical protein [Herpetosiphon llansteffanensis]|uniref:hypothetical protein n=1 Tax=Herpetosiphon llansteffanensis TaxID=2094568 RepID=UPI000D7CC0EA|nr:hypothetical protein [Herpetosiphon llansteffanensis]
MLVTDNSNKTLDLKFRSAYRLYGITNVAIFMLSMIYSINNFDYSMLFLLLFIAAHFVPSLVNTISVLRITNEGLFIRRGWQRAFIAWHQIESLGVAKYQVFKLIPYIVLCQPIKGFPKVDLKEIAPEHQQRSVTLEGWHKQQALIEAIYQHLPQINDSYTVMPTIKKDYKTFIYYDDLNRYILGFSALIMCILYLFKYGLG